MAYYQEREKKIMAMHTSGCTQATIGRAFGLSGSRVSQILEAKSGGRRKMGNE